MILSRFWGRSARLPNKNFSAKLNLKGTRESQEIGMMYVDQISLQVCRRRNFRGSRRIRPCNNTTFPTIHRLPDVRRNFIALDFPSDVRRTFAIIAPFFFFFNRRSPIRFRNQVYFNYHAGKVDLKVEEKVCWQTKISCRGIVISIKRFK